MLKPREFIYKLGGEKRGTLKVEFDHGDVYFFMTVQDPEGFLVELEKMTVHGIETDLTRDGTVRIIVKNKRTPTERSQAGEQLMSAYPWIFLPAKCPRCGGKKPPEKMTCGDCWRKTRTPRKVYDSLPPHVVDQPITEADRARAGLGKDDFIIYVQFVSRAFDDARIGLPKDMRRFYLRLGDQSVSVIVKEKEGRMDFSWHFCAPYKWPTQTLILSPRDFDRLCDLLGDEMATVLKANASSCLINMVRAARKRRIHQPENPEPSPS